MESKAMWTPERKQVIPFPLYLDRMPSIAK